MIISHGGTLRCPGGHEENWRELRAIDEQIESISAEFDGEDEQVLSY